MELHANAALSLNKRRLLCRRVVEERWTLTKAAAAAEVSVRCARKWVGRYRAEGELGLLDRSSAPATVANRTPRGSRRRRSLRCAGCGSPGPRSPSCWAMALSTVSGILTRIGMGKLGRLGLEPAARYERARPGELIHIDVKKLGRISAAPGNRVHRRASTQPRRAPTATAGAATRSAGSSFTSRSTTAPAWPTPRSWPTRRPPPRSRSCAARSRSIDRHGINVERLLTDNGSAYRSTVHAIACRALGIRHLRTRPYRPQTNGKAERFIRTMLGGWAYGAIYRNSSERTAALDGWLWHYNHHRRHSPSATSPRSLASTSEPTCSGLTARTAARLLGGECCAAASGRVRHLHIERGISRPRVPPLGRAGRPGGCSDRPRGPGSTRRSRLAFRPIPNRTTAPRGLGS